MTLRQCLGPEGESCVLIDDPAQAPNPQLARPHCSDFICSWRFAGEVEVSQELGLNGGQTHRTVEDPRFLYWADRPGLLHWGKIANAFRFSGRAIDRHTREWRDVVLGNRNHPSIIAWCHATRAGA